ncbi:MAG: type II secretion system F family protein [Phycisphaerales bacterium]|nr:type II secretion system F family protein [Phycisphaerales bacterium]
MPAFRYEHMSTGSAGNASAVIEAPDRAAAVRLLRTRGITPIKVEPISDREAKKSQADSSSQLIIESRPSSAASEPAAPVRGKMSKSELSTFVRELATAVQAGLPLVQALKTIQRQIKAPGQKAVVGAIVHEVEHGKSLGDACAKVGKPFGELTVSLIRAGEVSGRLGEILEQTANLLDREIKLRRALVNGSIYPAILFVLIASAIGVIAGYIVPRIIRGMQGKLSESQLPFPTRVVLGVGDLFAGYWWLIAIVIFLVVFAIRQAYRTPSSRLSIDRGLLKVPVVGLVLRDIAVARFTRTLGTLVNAGLPALTALRITKSTLVNKAMEGVVEEVCEQVSSGKTIAEPMERSGYFPSLLTQIIGLGEKSGRLPQMLLQAAGVFEDRTENSMKLLTSLFPIVMVLIASVVVAFVMTAVLLPIMQLQDLAGT